VWEEPFRRLRHGLMVASVPVATEVSRVVATGAEPPSGGPPPDDGVGGLPADPPPPHHSTVGRVLTAVVCAAAAVATVWFGLQRGDSSNVVVEVAATHTLGAVSGAPVAGPRGYVIADQPFPDLQPLGGWRPVGGRADRVAGRDVATLIYQHAGRRVTLSLVSGAPVRVPDRARQVVVKGVRLARQTRDGRVIVSWNQAGQTAVLSGVGLPARQLYSLAAAATRATGGVKIPQRG
jgi:hypothetical protein